MTAQPRRFSNRHLLRQMEAWGWHNVGTFSHRSVLMAHSLTGIEVELLAAHVKQGNKPQQIKLVYDATTGGDVDRFWDGPNRTRAEPIVVKGRPMLAKALDVGTHDAGPHFESTDSQPTEETSMSDSALTVVPTTDTVAAAVRRATAQRGTSRSALRYLTTRNGRICTAPEVANALDADVRAVSKGLQYLANIGLAERVEHGSYRLSESARWFLSARPGWMEQAMNLDALAEVVAEAWAAGQAQVASPVREPVDLPKRADVDDDTLYAVLDCLLPGRSFTIRDLAAIDEWKQATVSLLARLAPDL